MQVLLLNDDADLNCWTNSRFGQKVHVLNDSSRVP